MRYKLKRLSKGLCIVLVLFSCEKKTDPDYTFSGDVSDSLVVNSLVRAAQDGDTILVDSLYTIASRQWMIPYTFKDSVYFLYHGDAKEVIWNGDFNSWGQDASFKNKGQAVGNSDLWLLKASFPSNARLDYKIVVDDEWIVDPSNPYTQWSGVGGGSPNSSLRMSEYQPDTTFMKETSEKGSLSGNKTIMSDTLGYEVNYNLYTPYSKDSLSSAPLLILTDGPEFLTSQLGSFKSIVDYLIASDKIEPIYVLFADPRNPENNEENRRMEEFGMNSSYAAFLMEELLPAIQPSVVEFNEVGIAGVSLGGLHAAYHFTEYPKSIDKIGILSPAFWYRPEIFDLWHSVSIKPKKVYLSSGTINDAHEDTERFYEILERRNINVRLDTIPQGHSWGNWRELTDNMLIYFYGK